MAKIKKERTGVIRNFDMKSPGAKVALVIIYILCVVIVVVSLFPIFWVIMAGFKELREFMVSTAIFPQRFDFSVYSRTWSQLNIFRNYTNSFYVIMGSLFCSLIFNGLLAYGIAILKPYGYKVISKMVMFTLLVPATISLVPLFINVTSLGLGGSFVPLWLAAGANAFFVVLFRQFFESLPFSLVEASRIDGCSPAQTFFKVVMPLSKPIFIVVSIFTVNAAWSDFLLPFLILRGSELETVMVRLFVFSTEQTVNVDDLMRAVVFSMIPPVLLFFIFQKWLTENIVTVGIKG
ncbi:MAG: carbohydrate ABC transporter permease [Oscillospiraceae bacterium]|jgi:multiple sugar transport system permease protein|nr:carbohydrate ABC transporter permease [Oscillospiraceae bacterium]